MTHLVLLATLAIVVPTIEVRSVDGRAVTGTLSELTAQRVTVQTADGAVTFRPDQLLSLAATAAPAKPETAPSVYVELSDGSTLTGATYEAAKGTVRLTLGGGDKLEFPTSALRFVRFSGPQEQLDSQWSAALKNKATADLLVVRKKDSIDFLEGVIGNVTADKVDFVLDHEPLDVKRSRVDGFIYVPVGGRALPEATSLIEDAAGWELHARSLELTDGKFQVVSTAGVKVTLPLETISRVDFSVSTLRYLSDLKPDAVEWTPFFELPSESPMLAENFKPRRDRGLEGPLRLAGKSYSKGLGLTSRTTVSYRVPAGFRGFKAIAGIDDAVRESGNVRLEIRGDGTKLFDQVLTGKDEPRSVDVDVANVKKLTILVDYGSDADVADHVNLCDARFTK